MVFCNCRSFEGPLSKSVNPDLGGCWMTRTGTHYHTHSHTHIQHTHTHNTLTHTYTQHTHTQTHTHRRWKLCTCVFNDLFNITCTKI